jgi:hypothetical protein
MENSCAHVVKTGKNLLIVNKKMLREKKIDGCWECDIRRMQETRFFKTVYEDAYIKNIKIIYIYLVVSRNKNREKKRSLHMFLTGQ